MADIITKDDLRREITAILKEADLTTTSAKKVRLQIEEKLEIDLSDRKKEVDDLVMECLEKRQDGAKDGGKKRSKNDEDDEDDDESEDDEEEQQRKEKRSAAKKPTKRAKKGSSDDESDDASDDNASDEEYSPTGAKKGGKGGGGKKGKGKGKKKGSDSDNDSDEDWNKSRRASSGGVKKGGAGGAKRGGGGYTRAYTLSTELAAVVGQESMARHEVVRKIWSIIKERNLYDPKNKQFAICDDELLKVFGVKRFRTFGMMKYLKNHFLD